DDPAELVAAELVDTEPVLAVRSRDDARADVGQVGRRRAVRREQRGEDRDDEEDRDDDEPGHGDRRVQEPADGVPAETSDAVCIPGAGELDRLDFGDAHGADTAALMARTPRRSWRGH